MQFKMLPVEVVHRLECDTENASKASATINHGITHQSQAYNTMKVLSLKYNVTIKLFIMQLANKCAKVSCPSYICSTQAMQARPKYIPTFRWLIIFEIWRLAVRELEVAGTPCHGLSTPINTPVTRAARTSKRKATMMVTRQYDALCFLRTSTRVSYL